jgi:uncharacterized protein (DUF3084 family)
MMIQKKLLSKRVLGAALTAIFLLGGPIGCGKTEIEQWRSKATALETELAATKIQLEDARKELDEAHAKDQQGTAKEEALTNELVKVKVERDKLKQELAALKRKR